MAAHDNPVCVVEDDPAMRDALLLMLRSSQLDACGYESAEALLAAQTGADAICVVSDLRLPGMDGLTLLQRLLADKKGSAVVMITGHGDIPLAVKALKAGALDFVEKPFDPGILLESVHDALVRTADSRHHQMMAAEIRMRRDALTAREREIMALVVEGHTNKTVAVRLGISVRTAEHHRASIMEKMGARTLSALVRSVLVDSPREQPSTCL